MTWSFIDGVLFAIILDLIGTAGILLLVHYRKSPCLCRLVGHKHTCSCDEP